MACAGSFQRSEHPWMHCTAGMTGGAVATMLFYPLDFLRTRMHVINAGFRQNPLCSAREIVHKEGIRRMYRGLGVSVASHSLGWGLYLLTFHSAHQQINSFLDDKGYRDVSPLYKDFSSACVAATITGTVLTPLQVLKTRRQLHDGSKSSNSSLRTIVCREGMRSLFKGIVPQIVLTGNTTIQVTLYEYLRRRFFTNTDNPSPIQVAMASAVSKAISSAFFNPLEVLRTRLQMLHQQGVKEYQGVIDGLSTIWRTEGVAGMYRGLPVNVARVIPSTVFAFVAYEKFFYFFSLIHSGIVSQMTYGKVVKSTPSNSLAQLSW